MGLDCSHDAFHGSYSAFNRFRKAVCDAIGGSYPPHNDRSFDENTWYWGDDYSKETHPGLYIFLCHSDCDGEISPEDCIKVANDLEPLIPKLQERGLGDGHIARAGGYGEVCQKFVNGCREATKLNEPLTFE